MIPALCPRKHLFVALVAALLLAGCGGRTWSLFSWTQPQQQPAAQESKLEHVTSASFDERVLKCDKPVLVDFYGEWCGPCKRLGPIVEQFADEHTEIRVVKINFDDNRDLAARFQVKALPTLLFFRGGQVVDDRQGFVPKTELEKMTAGAVAAGSESRSGLR